MPLDRKCRHPRRGEPGRPRQQPRPLGTCPPTSRVAEACYATPVIAHLDHPITPVAEHGDPSFPSSIIGQRTWAVTEWAVEPGGTRFWASDTEHPHLVTAELQAAEIARSVLTELVRWVLWSRRCERQTCGWRISAVTGVGTSGWRPRGTRTRARLRSAPHRLSV